MIINADYIIRVIRTKSDCGCNKIQYHHSGMHKKLLIVVKGIGILMVKE
jgi:hypothetical protein